jgi:Fe2+ or Zn2+ uptake regulation protein
VTTTTGADSREEILAALHSLGQATAADIAKATGLAYSTTTAKLRALQSAGQVQRRTDDNGRTLWHTNPPDHHTTADADTTAGNSTSGRRTRGTNTGGRNAKTKREPDTDAAGTARPRSKPAGRKQTGADQQPTLTPAGKSPGGNNPSGNGRRTRRAAVTSEPATAPAPTAGADGTADDVDGARPRRAKGALRAEVLAVLQDHPDQVFKVSQVAKQLPGASSGAIANALDKLVADGNARQVAEQPTAYQAE